MSRGIARLRKKLFHRKAREAVDIKARYDDFVRLLAENDYALELISELQERYQGKSFFTIPYLRNITKKLLISVQNTVQLLAHLTDGQFPALESAYESMVDEIRQVLTGVKEPIYTPTAVSLREVHGEMADKIGDKMANLGTIANHLGLPVPEGFATTVCAYSQFIEYNHLDFAIEAILKEVESDQPESLARAEEQIKGIISKAQLPPELSYYLEKGYRELSEKDPGCFVSFRSSALGEDTEYSFAGQYSSLLNVPPTRLAEAYKEVVASKYNARAIYYRRKKGYRDEDVAMSVGILKMVDAVSAGVVFTEDPNNAASRRITISAIWGLGPLLVEGHITPDIYVFDKEKEFHLVSRNISTKRVKLVADPEGGVRKVRVPEQERNLPCLDESQLERLLAYARVLEDHYQWPQDIEWALDADGTMYVLQSRPLSLIETEKASSLDDSSYEVLLRGGQTACSGIAAGPVFRYRSEHDLSRCPRGAVLVASRTSPRLVKVMDRVSAIVTNVGSLTDHMAALAREFQVPTLVNTRKATKVLAPGQKVLVDATHGAVYAGAGQEPLQLEVREKRPLLNVKATEAYRILERVINLITPLNLCDPRAPDFRAEACRSLHDIVRFAHEMSLNAMVELGRQGQFTRKSRTFRLQSQLPLSIYLIDIEGDIVRTTRKGAVRPEQVNSELFQAFWAGLSHRGLYWGGLQPAALDLKGFFSAMSQTLADTLAAEQAMGYNYFILARNYLNASLRFGYHFTTIDAYVCGLEQDNYISMTFAGGAAPRERRERRARFIQTVLIHLDFDVELKHDFVRARVKYCEPKECAEKLDLLGRLVGCTRLIDMALKHDALVDQCVRSFMAGDYSLGLFNGSGRLRPPGQP